MYNIAIWKVFIEIYYMATVAHAFLKRQAGMLGPCNPQAQMCFPGLMRFLPPQGHKGYPGPAGHPGEQVRAKASAPPCLLSHTPAPASPWPPPRALLHQRAPEPGSSASHPAGAPTTPHLSSSHICLKELKRTPAQRWHELLNSG